MKSNFFLQVIIVCLLLTCGSVCRAGFDKAQALEFASTKGAELLTAFQEPDLNKRYQRLDELFLAYVDTDYISRFVVGKYWRQMTPVQKKRYQELFVRYGLAYYKTLPLDYVQKVSYEIKGAEPDGAFMTVSAVVHVSMRENPQDVALVFRLHETQGGQIKAVDVKVAESSLLLAYRSKFYEMMAQEDGEIDWFLEDLEDLTSSFEHSLDKNVSEQQKSLELVEENN